LAAVRYVEINPVAAGLVENPGDYRWSSARAHLDGKDDALGTGAPLLEMVGDWSSFLSLPPDTDYELMRKHERTGRPMGKATFVENLEQTMGRILRPQKPGPKKQEK
jgi:REP-associated tyrosine transposase